MIVSHAHRFIFLKVRKTAGTSIEIALSRVAGDDAIVTPIVEKDIGHEPRNHLPPGLAADPSPEQMRRLFHEARADPRKVRDVPYYNHMPARLARAKLGDEIWSTYFKFCFERNPWDKVVSMYGWHTREDQDSPPPFEQWLLTEKRVESDWPIYSIDERCAVDAIGRYETLMEDLGRFLQRVGMDPHLELPQAKSGLRRHVRYSPSAAEHVRKVFWREIGMGDYDCPAELRD